MSDASERRKYAWKIRYPNRIMPEGEKMPYSNLNDETLVMLTLAGEQSAYEVLVNRYRKAVVASAFSVTHNAFLAEDTAQDAFVTAWMKLDTLNEPEKYSAWVCRIAKNCGVNMLRQYRGFLSIDTVENHDIADETPVDLQYEKEEESAELHKSVSRLPERIKTIITLHYFEGLSVSEIADRLRISQGTIKSGLHDGRKRIRKELCAMNEKWSDTFAEKVMKKVEELKLWQFKTGKHGFETVYKDVLRDVEELPESGKKHHALADVLMRGWWWLPGDKNDALFARIKEYAVRGHNEDVMEFITTRERQQIPYEDRQGKIEFIRDKQIPYLEKAGFTKALAREWFWLGYYYFRENRYDEGVKATEKTKEILQPSDSYYALAVNTLWYEEKLNGEFKEKDNNRYRIGCRADELRYSDSSLRYWKEETANVGYLQSVNCDIHRIFRTASLCDGYFYNHDLAVGEYMTGSDGTTLLFESDNEKVDTPADVFDGCQLWITKHFDTYNGTSVYKVYYKDGIGIVKYTAVNCGTADTRLLGNYHINGGSGLLPMQKDNTWEYVSEYDPKYMLSEFSCRVIHADDKSVMIASKDMIERLGYDENSWLDMIEQIRNEYWMEKDNHEKLCDVSHAIERTEALAKTPMQKAHTKAAASVARRIMATDQTLNPERTAEGYWNFFQFGVVHRERGHISVNRNSRWSFEWKGWCNGFEVLLCNHIYGILQDAGRYLWSDEWKIGADSIIEYYLYDSIPLKVKISCSDGGRITTKAGTFDNCLKISFDIEGMDDYHKYRGGNKEYYFAEGIGIIKAVNELENLKTATYELVSYEGRGEGYMPVCDGLVRKYEAVGLTDGFYASSEYTYVEDDDGDIVIFADKCGIKNITAPITMYSSVRDEIIEEELWAAKKYDESRLRHDVNNFRLLLHFLGRDSRYLGAPEKAAAWSKENIKIIENLSNNGEIPKAWLGFYWRQHFSVACRLFGCGEKTKEEGYAYLQKAFELYPAWENIPDGELLDVGDEMIYGGVKLVKGKGIIELPDGTRESIDYADIFYPKAEHMYYGMTAKHGWEWFDSVREEERFKEYIERAKLLMESEKVTS